MRGKRGGGGGGFEKKKVTNKTKMFKQIGGRKDSKHRQFTR